MVSDEPLRALVRDIGRFPVRDRALIRAQADMARALDDGVPLDRKLVARYLSAVKRYFGGFEREARVRLADVDRRLAKVGQMQYNLTAERGVAVKRVELTQGVLARVLEIAGE
jgi:hypothetical protein